jgi:alkylglycerol monooxygenase
LLGKIGETMLAMQNDLILFAIPFFIIFMLVEIAYGIAVKRNTYKVNDVISSLSQGLISQAVVICIPFFQIGAYELISRWLGDASPLRIWQHWYGWLVALLIYDFLNYWVHRVSHECALFWGCHVVHHQSQFFNLSTALRQESLFPVVSCFFFFPMALLGIPTYQFAVVSVIVLLYQFLIHTEHIGKLGWFDLIFSSHSNHRVHHAINDEYIDKNFGAILIIWDRIFGTYQKEDAKCIYGTKTPLNSWSPLKALSTSYCDIFLKSRSCKGFKNKLRAFYKGPDWMPDGVSLGSKKHSATAHEIYDPPFKKYGYFLAVGLFMAAFLFVCFLTFSADEISYPEKVIGLIATLLVLYCASFYMESKYVSR